MTEEESTPQVVNLRETAVESVQAELVRVHQSGVKEVTAQEVGLYQAGAGRVTASTVSTHESGAGMIQAEEVNVVNGGVGVARTKSLHLKGDAGILLSETASVSEGTVTLLAGRTVETEHVNSVILLAGQVNGDVQTMMDTRGAAIAGLIGGLTLGLFYMAAEFLFRRD